MLLCLLPLVAACGGARGEPSATEAAPPARQATTQRPAAPAAIASAHVQMASTAKPRPATESGLVDAPQPVLFPEAMSALEQRSPWDLPPEMRLTAARRAALQAAVLQRRILQR